MIDLVTMIIAAVVLAAVPASTSDDAPLLIISGGGGPPDNAINHLHNVQWVEQLWTGRGRVWSLVADGTDPTPDAARAVPPTADGVDYWLQRLLIGSWPILEFVNSTSRSLHGPATINALQQWVAGEGATLAAGTVLNVYVTDHGTRNDKESEIVLWGENIGAAEFARVLNGLPEGVGVRLIMAQCYSGGFVDTVHRLLDQGRTACGFFSTLPDRLAAGCRYDPAGAAYNEFTTAFFEQLFGVRRIGAADVEDSGESVASYAAAFANLGQSLETIDIPNRSADWMSIQGELEPTWTVDPSNPDELPTMAVDPVAGRLDELDLAIAEDLLVRFPWLMYPYQDGFTALYDTNRARIKAFIAGHQSFPEIQKLEKLYDQQDRVMYQKEQRAAQQLRQQFREPGTPGGARQMAIGADAAGRMLACENAAPPGK